jgi:hypothetical protein
VIGVFQNISKTREEENSGVYETNGKIIEK